ncbi:MAG: phosphatase PAP2 family protein [Gemmatimonadaceae bacterium]|nr:phosphatase PAP2 family protein [Gemmatimonadaceae bacterium]
MFSAAWCAVALVGCLLSTAAAAWAQDVPQTSNRGVVITREWWTFGAFALGVVAAAPFDSRLARQFERTSLHESRTVDRTAGAIRALGDPGTLLLSVGSFAVGRLAHRPTLADVGLHASEAALFSGATSAVLKQLVGRARPNLVRNDDADVFRPASGASGYTSFPSGHTTVAFAAASAVSAELARSVLATRHPRVAYVVAPILFGSASLVGISRMYHDAHWASDVVAAAGIGTVAGRMVVRRHHDGPRGRVERWLLPAQVVPTAGGGAAVWNIAFR